MNRSRSVLVLGVLLSLGLAATAAEWSRFRGPNGTGTAADKDVPVEWSDKENVRWKVAIPGKGHSSPVVWGKRLFLQTAAADGKDRALVCVDTDKGDVLWTKSVPGNTSSIHARNSLASSTPATDGERVYCLFWDGKNLEMYAFNFKGEIVWKRGDADDKDREELGVYEIRKDGKGQSQHGAGTSPIVQDGKVFLANDKDGSSQLLAFDAKNGKTLWKADRQPFRTCYSTPFILDKKDGASELIVGSTAGLTGYDPKTGHENWNYTWKFKKMALRTVASPIAHDGLVFLNSGDGSGERAMIAVKLGGEGDVSATNLAWENRKTFPYVPTLLASGEYLFGVNDDGFAFCWVAKTGEEVWSERLGSPMWASPILVNGKIYAAGADGKVYVFEAAPKYKLLAVSSIDEAISATPAVADNCLYVRGGDHLFCIAKPKK